MEFIHRSAPPRLGNMLILPPAPTAPESSAVTRTLEVGEALRVEAETVGRVDNVEKTL